jgi:hypothetical protein
MNKSLSGIILILAALAFSEFFIFRMTDNIVLAGHMMIMGFMLCATGLMEFQPVQGFSFCIAITKYY